VADGKVFREYLKPGQPAEATFCLCFTPEKLEAREYCNLHGPWKA
jgi:superoxide reductase